MRKFKAGDTVKYNGIKWMVGFVGKTQNGIKVVVLNSGPGFTYVVQANRNIEPIPLKEYISKFKTIKKSKKTKVKQNKVEKWFMNMKRLKNSVIDISVFMVGLGILVVIINTLLLLGFELFGSDSLLALIPNGVFMFLLLVAMDYSKGVTNEKD